VTIHAAIRTLVNSFLMPLVLLENAATSRHANQNYLEVCADCQSMSAICQNFVLGPRNSAQKISSRLMAWHVKLGKPSATRAHAGPILTNAVFFGAHLARNQIINVTNKTEKVADMGTVDTTG